MRGRYLDDVINLYRSIVVGGDTRNLGALRDELVCRASYPFKVVDYLVDDRHDLLNRLGDIRITDLIDEHSVL